MSLISRLVSLSLSICLLAPAACFAIRHDPTPIQQRIALLPTGMTVSWSTLGPISGLPTVEYGLSSSQLNLTAKGFSLHYDASITHFHHVPLHALHHATRYYWTVTSPANVSSPTLTFVTAPAAGSSTPYTVAINGDLGIGNSEATLRRLRLLKPSIDWHWHIGDLSYADDFQATDFSYEEITEGWMDNMTDIWNERPYQVLPGNHETSCSEHNLTICTDGQRNFTSFRYRFHMPHAESGSVSNMHYSFDYGLVHYVSIDTEVDYPGSPEGPGTFLNAGSFGDQLRWLEKDLQRANANRHRVPWILVGGHHPYYSSFCCDGTWPASQPAFEPLFNRYGVDIVYWGHIHLYERMFPLLPGGLPQQLNYSDPTAPVYIISAAAGNMEGLVHGEQNTTISAFLDQDEYGVGLLTVEGAESLHWQWLTSETGEVRDELQIVKTRGMRQRWADEHRAAWAEQEADQQPEQPQPKQQREEVDELELHAKATS